MENWTSRPQDKWPRLTGLANRDRSSVEEAQMSTYESPYTAENPASFYHYSLHPDDLATRRSISVYSLKDPDKKKKGSRFPQCRVCFATMLLVSLGVAIAVAVTLAIMLSNPHPKFYRTKGSDNATLSKDFLKEKEVDFGNDICDLMSAMFDLRDSSDQSRKVTDCSVILTDSPGNMVINVKLNVDETFIKSDAEKIKSMLVANAFTLSSNSSVKKLMIAVPSNQSDIPPTASDITSPLPTRVARIITPSVSAEAVLSSAISSSSNVILPSFSQAILASHTASVGIGGVSRDTSVNVTDDSSSAFALLNTASKTSAIITSVEYPTADSVSDVVPSLSPSASIFISPDSSLSHWDTELTSTAERLSSTMPLYNSRMSIGKTESMVTNVLRSHSVLNPIVVSDLKSSEPIITATASTKHVSESTRTSHLVYTSPYKGHISSSIMPSGYGTSKEEITSYTHVSAADMSLIASYTPTEEVPDSSLSASAFKVRNSGNTNEKIIKTSIEYGLESTVMATKVLYTSQVISSSEEITNIDQQSSESSLSSSSVARPPLHFLLSTQNIPSSYVALSVLSNITPNVTLKTYPTESGTVSVSRDNLIQTNLSTTSVLYPSEVINTADITSLQSDNPSRSATVSLTEIVSESQPVLKWLDTTMFMSENEKGNNSSLPFMNKTNDNEMLDTSSSLVTVPELRMTSPSPVNVPELKNDTYALVKPEVKLPVLSTTQSPTSTTQDVGRAIFESEISNRAMGTASPEDFWDNILKMVQYTSTKKPNMGVTSSWKNISSDPNTSSVVNKVTTSSYKPSSLLLTRNAESSTDTPSMSSVYKATSVTEINASISSSVIQLKSSDSVVYDSTTPTSLLSSNVYASPTTPSLIRATPVLTAQPGFTSSIEHSAVTDNPVVEDSTAKVYRLMTASVGKSNDLISSDGKRNASVKLTNNTKHGEILLSTTLDASDVSLFSVKDATSNSLFKTSSEGSDLVMKTAIVSSAMQGPSTIKSGIVSSQSSATATLSDDYAFYDLMPASLESSSVPGSTGVSSTGISQSSSTHQQPLTDDIDFYDLMPVSKVASSGEVSPSKTPSGKMNTDILPTGSLIFFTENFISSFSTEMQSESSIAPSSSVNMETSQMPKVDTSSSLDMETSVTVTVDDSKILGIEPSSTHEEGVTPSVNMEDLSTVYSNQHKGTEASIKVDIAASPSSSLQPSSIIRELGSPVRDVSPSLSTKMLSAELYSSSLLSSHSFDVEFSTSTNGIHSTTMAVTPSLETVSSELHIKTSSLDAVQLTSLSSSSPGTFVQETSSDIKATTSLSDVTASVATEPPPSEPAVFNPGSEFGHRLFFANDFSKMDFTRNDIATDDQSMASSLFNTVPMIPRVTTPSVLGQRVRVPDLFQGETNPFQAVPTTPKPAVTTPKVVSPAQKDKETDPFSSGKFLFDLGSLGGGFRNNLGLGNINFN